MKDTMIKEFYSRLAASTGFQNFRQKGLVFHTRASRYFFDSGTGKTYECDNMTAVILDTLINGKDLYGTLKNLEVDEKAISDSFNDILDLVECEHILQMPRYTKFETLNISESEAEIGSHLNQVVFEVTQKCNLRCKYCIYNDFNDEFRDFSYIDMEWETLKKGLDYVKEHSGNKIIIGFYGGEPLVNFDLVKKGIEYFQTICKEDQEVIFTMTTNLTLVTEEIASYLASIRDMRIVCSFDGPENIQNKFRIDKNKKGTFDEALRGLNLLVNAFKHKENSGLSINMVLCPPYEETKFEEMKRFFESLNLPQDTYVHYNYVEKGTIIDKDVPTTSLNYLLDDYMNYTMQQSDPMKYWAMNKICDNNGKDDWFLSSIEKNDLSVIQNHYLEEYPKLTLKRNGCCIPGSRRLYITADGKFNICERVGISPSIGNLDAGINIKNIEKYYFNDYDNKSNDCKDCWASHLCTLCYASSMKENGVDQKIKKESCHAMQTRLKNCLIEYYQILEENPEFIDMNICTTDNKL